MTANTPIIRTAPPTRLHKPPAQNPALAISLDEAVKADLNKPSAENTERSYESGVDHFLYTWGGKLPATELDLCRYLKYFGDVIGRDFDALPVAQQNPDNDPRLNIRSLEIRLSNLAEWYRRHSFKDATQSPAVRKQLRELKKTFSKAKKKAKPLWAEDIMAVSRTLLTQRDDIDESSAKSRAAYATALRDNAFLLIGWWRGFRASELIALRHDMITLERKPARRGRDERIQLKVFLSNTKGDRLNEGEEYTLPALPELPELCPVAAYLAWRDFAIDQRDTKHSHLAGSSLTGSVFCKIYVGGQPRFKPLHENSVNKLLKAFLKKGGLNYGDYSSHSLRRGILNEMLESGVALHDASKWVKHKSSSTTEDYLDPADNIAETVISSSPALLALTSSKKYSTPVAVTLKAQGSGEPSEHSFTITVGYDSAENLKSELQRIQTLLEANHN